MELGQFAVAFKQRLVEINAEVERLTAKIRMIESRECIEPHGRIMSRLGVYRHQLGEAQRNKCAANWISVVVEPIYQIVLKRLGKGYQGFVILDQTDQAKLRFASVAGALRALELRMTLTDLCVMPRQENVQLRVVRSIVLPGSSERVETLPLDTPIAEIVTSFRGH